MNYSEKKRLKPFIIAIIILFLVDSLKATECVVVCMGGYSYRYHSSEFCRGLNNCRGGLKTITLKEARNMGRTPCRVCGGNPFNCAVPGENTTERKSKPKNDCQSQINRINDKHRQEIETLESQISEYEDMIDQLKSPFAKPKTFYDSLSRFLTDKEQYDNDKATFDREMKKFIWDKNITEINLKSQADSLNNLSEELTLLKKDLENKQEELNKAINIHNARIDTTRYYVQNGEKIKIDLKYKETILREKEEQLRKKENELSDLSRNLDSKKWNLEMDINANKHIYPHRFYTDFSIQSNYLFLQGGKYATSFDFILGIYYRFDIDKTDFGSQNRVNRIGFEYSFRGEFENAYSKYLGYQQNLALIFDFQEYIRTGIGYNALVSKSFWGKDNKYFLPITVFVTREPHSFGINSTLIFNSIFKYQSVSVGLTYGVGTNFLRF